MMMMNVPPLAQPAGLVTSPLEWREGGNIYMTILSVECEPIIGCGSWDSDPVQVVRWKLFIPRSSINRRRSAVLSVLQNAQKQH